MLWETVIVKIVILGLYRYITGKKIFYFVRANVYEAAWEKDSEAALETQSQASSIKDNLQKK